MAPHHAHCPFMPAKDAASTDPSSCLLINIDEGAGGPQCLGSLMKNVWEAKHEAGGAHHHAFVPAVPEAQYCMYEGSVPCSAASAGAACKHGIAVVQTTLCPSQNTISKRMYL